LKTKKLKVGLTGSIGSGKSSFAEYLSGKGYPVLKADDISKEILSTNTNVQKRVIKAFGEKSFKNGVPDKKYLADNVFSSIDKVQLINSILHPLVLTRLEREMDEILKTNEIVFAEAALIYEADMEDMFNYVVLIAADEPVRKKRKNLQDNIPDADFVKRNMNQIPDEEKKKRADFIFENNGSIEELHNKADLLLVMLKSL
jgi:dephospho-CoA kinase